MGNNLIRSILITVQTRRACLSRQSSSTATLLLPCPFSNQGQSLSSSPGQMTTHGTVQTRFARHQNAPLNTQGYSSVTFTHHTPLESACQRAPSPSALARFQVGFLHLDQFSLSPLQTQKVLTFNTVFLSAQSSCETAGFPHQGQVTVCPEPAAVGSLTFVRAQTWGTEFPAGIFLQSSEPALEKPWSSWHQRQTDFSSPASQELLIASFSLTLLFVLMTYSGKGLGSEKSPAFISFPQTLLCVQVVHVSRFQDWNKQSISRIFYLNQV